MKREVIGVDIGGTHLRTALVRNNKIIFYQKGFTPKTKNELLEALYTDIDKLMTKNVVGIGIACPGPLKDGKILNTENIPLKNFDLKSAVKKRYPRLKVEIENDAKCEALAESKSGCKKKNFIIMTIGTGIGGGAVIDGKLYGRNTFATEFGHIVVDGGKYLEDLVGVKYQHKISKQAFGKIYNISELMRLNNPRSRRIVDDFTNNLGQGIGGLINIFDPEIVILKGGISEAGKPLLDLIKKETKKYVFLPHVPDIIWTSLEHPGTLGASLLVE